MQRPLILLAGLLVGGTAGYFPLRQQYIAQQEAFEKQLRDLRDEMRRVQDRSRLSELVAQLGTVLVKAEQNDYAQARERSTKFFDAVRQAQTAAPEGNVKQVLTRTLARRDEITADLAVSSDVAIPKLRELHTTLQQLLE